MRADRRNWSSTTLYEANERLMKDWRNRMNIQRLREEAEADKAILSVWPTCRVVGPKRVREEIDHRVYYQSIVYAVCHILDRHLPRGEEAVCGTVDNPSDEVQTTLTRLLQRLTDVEAKRCQVNEGEELRCDCGWTSRPASVGFFKWASPFTCPACRHRHFFKEQP